MALSKASIKYGGEEPPDSAFYQKTFVTDSYSLGILVRGFHIDMQTARQIDNFVDNELRKDSEIDMTETEDIAEGSIDPSLQGCDGVRTTTRKMKFWEMTYGKKTQWLYEPIHEAMLAKFACFSEKWRKTNRIPWVWAVTAMRCWVRRNRQDMVDHPELRKAGGSFVRKYENKKAKESIAPTPTHHKKRKRAYKLIDQHISIELFDEVEKYVDEGDVELIGGELEHAISATKANRQAGTDERPRTAFFLERDTSSPATIVPVIDILSRNASARDYDEDGDVRLAALDYAELHARCAALAEVTDECRLIYRAWDDKERSISDSTSMQMGLRQLHGLFERQLGFPMAFIKAPTLLGDQSDDEDDEDEEDEMARTARLAAAALKQQQATSEA